MNNDNNNNRSPNRDINNEYNIQTPTRRRVRARTENTPETPENENSNTPNRRRVRTRIQSTPTETSIQRALFQSDIPEPEEENVDSKINLIPLCIELEKSKDANDNAKSEELRKQIKEAIDTNNFNWKSRDEFGNTIFMYLVYLTENDLAKLYMSTGKELLDSVNNDMETAFLMSILIQNHEMTDLIMKSGKDFAPDQISVDNMTALSYTAQNGEFKLSLDILNLGVKNIGIANASGTTPLIYACAFDRNTPFCIEFINKLIDSGRSNSISITKDFGYTALIYCILGDKEDIALKLIDTGKSNPGVICKENKTALIFACQRNNYNIAKRLLELDYKSNYFIADDSGSSAIDYANHNGWNDLVKIIENLSKEMPLVNVNAKGTSIVEPDQNDLTISKYLAQDSDNICIELDNQYYYTKYSYISKQSAEENNIKYKCYSCGYNKYNTSGVLQSFDYTNLDNIDKSVSYLYMASIIPRQILIKMSDIDILMKMPYMIHLLSLKFTGETLPGIMSSSYIPGDISADHCQPDSPIDVYIYIPMTPICDNNTLSEEKVESIVEDNNKISIKYKNIDYTYSVNEQTTIDMLKNIFLNDLMNKDIIKTQGGIVKFIFGGRILNDPNQLVMGLGTLPITIQALVSFPTGGKRRTSKYKIKRKNNKRTKKLNRSRKYTKRYYKNKFKKRTIKK